MTTPDKGRVPTLNFEEFREWMSAQEAKSSEVGESLCNIWGSFRFEERTNSGTYWHLADEERLTGIRILMHVDAKFEEKLPKVKPGYVVRIHRVYYNKKLREAGIKHPNTVVCWSIYQQVPTPLTIAKNPTITEVDEKRRKELEFFFIRNIEKAKELAASRIPGRSSITVAGRLKDKFKDQFDHIRLHFEDGTGQFAVRIFKPNKPHDTVDHYETALTLEPGDLFVVTGSTMHKSFTVVDLSCNLSDGRSIRKLDDPLCALAVTLNEDLKKLNPPPAPAPPPPPPQARPQDLNNNSSQDSTGPVQNVEPAQKRLRRSPRLNQEVAQSSQSSAYSSQVSIVPLQEVPPKPIEQPQPLPSYTTLEEIESGMRRSGRSSYQFFDIAGQIRGVPNETPKYNNMVLQFFDGSKNTIKSFHVDLATDVVEECVTILVFNPAENRPQDTKKHIEDAKKLKEGDLVLIRNVKVQIRDDKFSFELASNNCNGKGIYLQEPNSKFGMHIEARVNNPPFEEEDIAPPEGVHYKDF